MKAIEIKNTLIEHKVEIMKNKKWYIRKIILL